MAYAATRARTPGTQLLGQWSWDHSPKAAALKPREGPVRRPPRPGRGGSAPANGEAPAAARPMARRPPPPSLRLKAARELVARPEGSRSPLGSWVNVGVGEGGMDCT